MKRVVVKLRIGEKIAIGFGSIGLIFLVVIWQYHNTLRNALEDYRGLQNVHEAKKSHAMAIANGILSARVFERDFLIRRDLRSAEEVEREVARIHEESDKLRALDQASADTANLIQELAEIYLRDFLAVVDAWKEMGLDHDSGLQGAFRDSVHELEKMAAQLNVGRSYLQLLQIRRSEKDLGLRRESLYRTKVFSLLDEFEHDVSSSEMDEQTRARLLHEIALYRRAFTDYSDTALANEDIKGGKGAFRQAAHRIEEILNTHFVPDLETNILQLRRREKDYLLRHDTQYADMAQAELMGIHGQIDASTISGETRNAFKSLLADYEKNFVALVAQNDRIDLLVNEMNEAVSRISALAAENAAATKEEMARVASEISLSSLDRARAMLGIVVVASLLGVFFAVFITTRISRPLRQMAALLDQLAYEDPVARAEFIAGGRDEVNAMAESVNTMADHRARFIEWWKGAMRENTACQKLGELLAAGPSAASPPRELVDALHTLRREAEKKGDLYRENRHRIAQLNDQIVSRSDELIARNPDGAVWLAADSIRHSAKSIQSIMKMMEK